jgi:hypothetical protein
MFQPTTGPTRTIVNQNSPTLLTQVDELREVHGPAQATVGGDRTAAKLHSIGLAVGHDKDGNPLRQAFTHQLLQARAIPPLPEAEAQHYGVWSGCVSDIARLSEKLASRSSVGDQMNRVVDLAFRVRHGFVAHPRRRRR